jgi:hypothetical protein
MIVIRQRDLDSSLVKELEENKYIIKYVEKPIQIPDEASSRYKILD